MKISVVVVTLNEEKNIGEALESVSWADELIVVDSGSKDKTLEITKQKNAKVFSHPFKNFADQKNHAMSHASYPWVLILDADERCDNQLREEIKLLKDDSSVTGYFVRRKNFFLGKELRFANHKNDYQMRLLKKDSACFKNKVHETVNTKGDVRYLKNGFLLHYTKRTVKEYLDRFEQYTSLEAEVLIEKGIHVSRWDCIWKPSARFAYFYVLQGGFLDGFHGFIYYALSYFYYLVKLLKTREKQGVI